jgi:hypothetical protein
MSERNEREQKESSYIQNVYSPITPFLDEI